METRQANGLTVIRYRIAGTNTVVYSAWEPYARHSTSQQFDDQNMGRVGTRQLTDDLDNLPAWSRERAIAVGQWHAAQYQEAYTAILAAFPDLNDRIPFIETPDGWLPGYGSMGEITEYER